MIIWPLFIFGAYISLRETRCLPSAQPFAECIFSSTRQIRSLPSVPQKTLGKQFFYRVYYFWHSAKINICRVYFFTLGKDFFAEYYFWHSAKIMIRRVFFYTSKELNFFTFNLKKFSTLHIQHVLLHVKIWYIFIFFAIFNLLTTFHKIFKLSQI